MLLILEEIARLGVPTTPTEINRSLDLPKPTLHRLFTSLEDEGFLQREHDGRSYSPGPRMRLMATGIISSTRIRSARLAVMNRLAKQIGETCNLAIADRSEMIYLDRVETEWPLRIQLPIGTRVPFHCTASGKLYLSTFSDARLDRMLANLPLEQKTERTLTDKAALLANIEQIRERGHSEDNEEFIEGMIALAVPINDAHGRMVSTLAFHAPTPRMPIDLAYSHLDSLKDAASELSRLLTEDPR
ncbi:MAG: IclR family transcriptional regulator [Pseudomonadota bacterium]